MKSWTMFLISIGFLVVAVSPQLPNPMVYVIAGLVMILIGVVKLKKNHSKKK